MPRAGLSRSAVVDLALAVVDDDGFSGLTLAAVAARAGVAVPSLYKHVAGLPDLRREVALRCIEELNDRLEEAREDRRRASRSGSAHAAADGGQVLALARAVRSFAAARPGRYLATQGAAWAQDPTAVELRRAGARSVALIAASLTPLGLPAPATVDAVRAVRALVHGFVVLELDGGFGLPDDVAVSFERAVEVMVAGFTSRA